MEIIGKVSRGSKMDQIYIPKNRTDLSIGSHVIIRALDDEIVKEKTIIRPYFYTIERIEPVKLKIINEIFSITEKIMKNKNIIITGSFLEEGFCFNDMDILIINVDEEEKIIQTIKKEIKKKTGIEAHILLIDNKSLINGLSIDPLYEMMLSKCIAKKKFIYKIKRQINYKLLDLHLLKSKNLIHGFNYLTGKEKYYLTRNMLAIYLFLKGKKINKENIEKEIKKVFKLKEINEITDNMLNKKFLERYKKIYNSLFNDIMEGIKDGSEQK